MKRFLTFSLALAFVVAMAGLSYANHNSTSAGDSANGIVNSRHNLSMSGTHFHSGDTSTSYPGTLNTTGTTEICVFCHTPHWANTGEGPLWNRAIVNDQFSDKPGNAFTVGDGSVACLSCHDGATALDALVNRPGKGSNTDGSTTHLGWVFQDDGAFHTHILGGRVAVGSNNLIDDHPITISYLEAYTENNGNPVHSLRDPNTTLSGIDLSANGAGPLVTGNLWAIEGNISDGTIADLLEDGEFVECVSCHDPHYKNQTNPDPDFVASYGATSHTAASVDGLFLKRVGGNSDSGLCRTCHAK